MLKWMRWLRLGFVAATAAVLLVAPFGEAALAQDTTAPAIDPEAIEADLANWLDLYNVPGVGYALIQDGEIIQVGGAGVRDTISNLPVTAETVFPIGSITKSFTALAVMQLVDAGLLDLDTPVIEYVPDLVLATEEATQGVTLRHLLAHTSGLARADQMLIKADSMSRAELVAAMAEIPIHAAPGEVYEYSNQGYILAGHVVELVSGQRWESYISENVFQPLGMESAGTTAVELLGAENHMLPHQLNVRTAMTPIEYLDLAAAGPAGAIIANVQDMATYMLFQMGDGTFDGQTILSQESMAEMHEMQITIGSNQEETLGLVTDMGYALGWLRFTYRDIDMISHDGSSDGYYATLSFAPEEQNGVLLLTNAQFAVLFTEVASITLIEQLFDLEPERDIVAYMNELIDYDPDRVERIMAEVAAYEADPAEFEPLVGQYSSVVGELTLFVEDERLYLRQIVEDRPFDFELVPYGSNVFYLNESPNAGSAFRFEVDDVGTVTMFQEGQQIGQMLGEGVEQAVVEDPRGRFEFNLPQDVTIGIMDNQIVLNFTEPDARIYVEGVDAHTNDKRTIVEDYLTANEITVSGDPLDARDLPLPDGSVWTQYVYALPDGTLIVGLIRLEDETAYLVGIQADQATLGAITSALNEVLLSFRLTG